GKAQTGTGKTAAFLIAIFSQMLAEKEKKSVKPGRPRALVIAPTRELSIQIIKDADVLGKYCDIKCLAVYGGMDHAAQQARLEEDPVDLIAATPGRLLDFIRSRVIDLSEVNTLVIDEADRMLDMGFIPDVRKIIRRLPSKDKRQTLLFSATLDEDVMSLASQWMPDPIKISVDDDHATVDTIKQIVYPIPTKEKFNVLYNTLKQNEGKRFLIFRNRKRDCENLCNELKRYGVPVAELSGDVDQKKRLGILENFRKGNITTVVATDVAGRGIHIDDVAFVINYDFPYEAEDYIHRIGRTGRAGVHGTAISFACEDESFIIPDIEELLGEELHCQQPEESLFQPPPAHLKQETQKSFRSSGGKKRAVRKQQSQAPRRGRRSGGRRKGKQSVSK
ncbi:MAG: DEAD/DEAH box helicase, partial [Lentisphaerae bacterium]|nr:DEAD/DEAH box helicase [Lentisphaerota bacterium]